MKNGIITAPEDGSNQTKAVLEQFRVDNLIAALYYSGLANITLQIQLPPTIGETGQNPGVANLVDQSKADYSTVKNWLTNTHDSQQKIQSSPVRHMYKYIVGVEGSIRSTREYYTQLEQRAVASKVSV